EQSAVLSKWNRVPNNLIRQKDRTTREWLKEDLTNPEEINTNQIQVAISRGENIEIRVRSVSEVGYPFSRSVSEWSETLVVPFPAELINDTENIVETSRNEQILVKFNRQL